jgi:hypothetical protein
LPGPIAANCVRIGVFRSARLGKVFGALLLLPPFTSTLSAMVPAKG